MVHTGWCTIKYCRFSSNVHFTEYPKSIFNIWKSLFYLFDVWWIIRGRKKTIICTPLVHWNSQPCLCTQNGIYVVSQCDQMDRFFTFWLFATMKVCQI